MAGRWMLACVWCAILGSSAVGQDAAPPAPPAQPGQPPPSEEKLLYVKMSTSMGDVFIELNHEKAPISVRNFLAYADKGHYEGTIFHRVIPNFMIQGGGFTEAMEQKKTEKPIRCEWKNGLKNTRGTLAMARTSEPDSATCQFFINVKDNDFLDQPQPQGGYAAYAVFGRVVAGMDVVDKIRMVKTETRTVKTAEIPNVPEEPVTIRKVERVSKDDADAAAKAEPKPGEGEKGEKKDGGQP